MISEARLVELQAYVWNEGEQPQLKAEFAGVSFDHLVRKVEELLQDKDFAKIVRIYPDEEIALWYRAFDDEFRGRQIIGAADEEDLKLHYEQRQKYCAEEVFSPQQIYIMEPTQRTYDLFYVVRVHIPEINIYELEYKEAERSMRIEYRELVCDCPDGERTWQLGSVWFDKKPVMVVNSSGRGGDEYSERFITDAALYGEMIQFLRQFHEDDTVTGFVRPDTIIPAMTEFYGRTIHDFYDVGTGKLKKT